jgi:Flp pilus assembly protein TadD
MRIARSARERYPGTMIGPWLEGVAEQGQGNLLRAEDAFLEALALAPRSHRAVSNLLAAWSGQKGPEHTAEKLLGLVERDPGFTYPLSIAAQAWLEAARPGQAEATIKRLLVAPQSAESYRAVAEFYLRVDRAGESTLVAAQGLARFPKDGELHALQGRAALLLGDREAALRSYEAAVAARPDDDAAMAQLARLLAKNGDAAARKRAMGLVRELQLDRPADPEVMAAMGVVMLTAGGDPRGALPWLAAAREQMPEDAGVRFYLASALARAGDAAGARKEVKEALRPGKTFDEEPEARKLARELGE